MTTDRPPVLPQDPRVVDVLLRWSPAQAFVRLMPAQLLVLAYHGVDAPERFAAQVDFLRKHYRPVALDDVLSAMAGYQPLPRRSVMITFDDGDISVYRVAAPILAQGGTPAIVFPIAGLVGTSAPFWWHEARELIREGGKSTRFPGLTGDEMVSRLKKVPNAIRQETLAALRSTAGGDDIQQVQLTWSQVRELASSGLEIGNHTLSHPCLPNCDDATLRRELTESTSLLAHHLGTPPRAFAYPNGDWDPRADSELRRLGYAMAFLFDHRPTRIRGNPFTVSRVRANASSGIDRFATLVSGLHPAVHRALGRD